ncbi:Rap1a/Tai family immunity protein [Bordetella sp. BOR01]|uniref:Rap1a/Tai family immunity protein n=1 Tax=Bordetella sp. BOR01 TaxID=2854779 RepID=UPI001C4953B6|nr:Rap1a/Tai family immunity protein [Bordetella sp. BOR01]MBV7483432.1 hypothetical protein [Bordetella sp. BOR01]
MALHACRPAFHRHLAALALVLAAAPAAAQQAEIYRPVTARDLYAGIMEGGLASWVQDPVQRTALSTYMATSYILGAADGAKGKQWCPAPDLDGRVMSEAVLNYLADLPQARLSENASVIVTEALGKAHPCKQ